MKSKLTVFISSKQNEFEIVREKLGKKISTNQYLESILLERKGADSETPKDSSIKSVKKSDIYVGIFGMKYSNITIEEYRKAVKQKIPCLIYVKKTKKRDEKLSNFLKEEIKSRFRYYEFSSKKELLQVVENDLNDFVFDLLVDGLKIYKRRKRKVIETVEERQRQVKKTIRKEQENVYDNFVKAANLSINKQHYLDSVVQIASFIEILSQNTLGKLGYPILETSKPLGWILYRLVAHSILNQNDISKINFINQIRSKAVHMGQEIKFGETRKVFKLGKEVMKKLSKVQKQPIPVQKLISLITNKSSYRDGEKIKISGGIQTMISGMPLALKIINPNGILVYIDQINVKGDGTFETIVTAGGPLWRYSGKYAIKVAYGHERNQTETNFQYVAK